MGMLDKDTVTWDRRAITGKTALGTPTTSSVAGFPVEVKGNWQEKSRSGRSTEAGSKPESVVWFYTSGVQGRVGDIVTFEGEAYTVEDRVIARSNTAGSVDHYKYRLERAVPGSAQP